MREVYHDDMRMDTENFNDDHAASQSGGRKLPSVRRTRNGDRMIGIGRPGSLSLRQQPGKDFRAVRPGSSFTQ
jgi:hypothetical protein